MFTEPAMNDQSSILNDVDKRMTGTKDKIVQQLRHLNNNFKTPSATHHTNKYKNGGHFLRPAANSSASSEAQMDKTPSAQQTIVTGETPRSYFDGQIINNSTDGKRKIVVESQNKLLQPFPEKQFITQESYLTVLGEVGHVKAIYHIFYVIFILYCMNSIFYDYFTKGT